MGIFNFRSNGRNVTSSIILFWVSIGLFFLSNQWSTQVPYYSMFWDMTTFTGMLAIAFAILQGVRYFVTRFGVDKDEDLPKQLKKTETAFLSWLTSTVITASIGLFINVLVLFCFISLGACAIWLMRWFFLQLKMRWGK